MKTTKINNPKNKYNKSQILKNVWAYYNKNNGSVNWSDCMKYAWNLAKNQKLNITTLYTKYYNDIYTFCIYKTNDNIACELTNDTFIKAEKNLINFDETKSHIKTWLINIAKNLVIDYYRTEYKKQSQLTHVSNYVDENGKEFFTLESDLTSDNSDNEYISDNIQKALNNLNAKYKQLFILREVENRGYNEIAEILGITESTARVHLNRAKQLLQKELSYLVA